MVKEQPSIHLLEDKQFWIDFPSDVSTEAGGNSKPASAQNYVQNLLLFIWYLCLKNYELSSQGVGKLLIHHSTKIVNKKQRGTDEFVNSPLPGNVLSNWFSKNVPQTSRAFFSSVFNIFPLPSFISFPNIQNIFKVDVQSVSLAHFNPIPKEGKRQNNIGLRYEEEEGAARTEQEGDWLREEEKVRKPIFWPVLVSRRTWKGTVKGFCRCVQKWQLLNTETRKGDVMEWMKDKGEVGKHWTSSPSFVNGRKTDTEWKIYIEPGNFSWDLRTNFTVQRGCI